MGAKGGQTMKNSTQHLLRNKGSKKVRFPLVLRGRVPSKKHARFLEGIAWNFRGSPPLAHVLDKCSAHGYECELCPGVNVDRLVLCCACTRWGHLECSYGIPEGRLCASHCQVIDPLRGVVVIDFNAGMGELGCLVPWRPWLKKYKIKWQEKNRYTGKSRWIQQVHELLPNLALEKHTWLGIGLIWKAPVQDEQEPEEPLTESLDEDEEEPSEPESSIGCPLGRLSCFPQGIFFWKG